MPGFVFLGSYSTISVNRSEVKENSKLPYRNIANHPILEGVQEGYWDLIKK